MINIFRYNIDKVTYTVKDLKENTIYIIKAAAVTSSGTGNYKYSIFNILTIC